MHAKAPLTQWALGLGKLGLLLGALGVTFGIFAIISLQLALRSREVPVPSLSGLTQCALAILEPRAGKRDTRLGSGMESEYALEQRTLSRSARAE